MDLSAAILSTQTIVCWTFLGILCAWMVLCAFLALRPQKTGKRETAGATSLIGAMPVFVAKVPLLRASAPVDVPLGGVAAVSAETAREIGSSVG